MDLQNQPGPPGRPIPGLEKKRDIAVEVLNECFARDIINLDEFERRVDLANKAETVDELTEVIADLPEAVPESNTNQRTPADRSSSSAPANFKDSRKVLSVMASRKLTGDWLDTNSVESTCVMSETVIDLRNVSYLPPVINIHINSVMAEVKIILPGGYSVQNEILPIMAEVKESDLAVNSNRGVVKLTGLALMASVKIL